MKKTALIVMLLLSGWVQAAETHDAAASAHNDSAAPHAILSHDARWAGVVIIISLGMFVMAAAIGAVKDMNTPDEPPADPHHHDDHGHDSHAHDAHGHDSHGH